MGLPNSEDYKGILYDKKERFYIHNQNKLIQIPSGKQISFDKEIIFAKISK